MKTKTNEITWAQVEEYIDTLRETKDGHAPMGSMDLPGEFFLYAPGDPRLDEAVAAYDKRYFAAHPEDREKYGYTGP
jgi:hypothetical protein